MSKDVERRKDLHHCFSTISAMKFELKTRLQRKCLNNKGVKKRMRERETTRRGVY